MSTDVERLTIKPKLNLINTNYNTILHMYISVNFCHTRIFIGYFFSVSRV